MKTWGPEKTLETALAFLPAAGRKVEFGTGWNPFNRDSASFTAPIPFGGVSTSVNLRRIYTLPVEIPQALRQVLADKIAEYRSDEVTDHSVRAGSVQERLIGGQQALSCVVDYTNKDARRQSIYLAWIQTESTLISFESRPFNSSSLAAFRWRVEPVLEMVRIP